MTTTRVTCHYCAGTGRREAYAHVDNGRCWHCLGTGSYQRKAPTKRQTLQDHIDAINAMIAREYPQTR